MAAVFSPSTGVLFNNPDGTRGQQQNILDSGRRQAARRGSVRLLVDGRTRSSDIEQLRQVLGRDVNAKSFVVTCQYGCMSSAPASVRHAKIFLFSTAGRAKRVTMIGSGNPNRIGHDNGWNNHGTVVGNDALYLPSPKYLSDMVLDRTVPNYDRTTATGPYKVYFVPRAKYDTMYDVLTGVRCLTPVAGRVAPRRSVVRVLMFLWTARRLAIARQLCGGCTTRAATCRSPTPPTRSSRRWSRPCRDPASATAG